MPVERFANPHRARSLTRTNGDLRASLNGIQKARDFFKGDRKVGIRHIAVSAARAEHTGLHRAAFARFREVNHAQLWQLFLPGARDSGSLICAAVLDHQHLTQVVLSAHKCRDLFQRRGQALSFIVSRDDDGEEGSFHGCLWGCACLLQVGVGGLEPPTSASQTQRASRLRYTPVD